jgi:hypothetical protein
MRLRIGLLLVLLPCLSFPVNAAPYDIERKKADCAETKAQMRKIRSKMRHGYTAKQGMRLEEQLRRLREKRARLCR